MPFGAAEIVQAAFHPITISADFGADLRGDASWQKICR
jgi:hypothetical protein